MLEVQKALFDSHKGPGASVTNFGPPRFLEGADGVGLWWGPDVRLACARGKAQAWRMTMDCDEQFRIVHLTDLDWEWTAAMHLLQGASLQKLLGSRYIPVQFMPAPIYSPTPRMRLLVAAEPLFPFASERLGEYALKLHNTIPSALPQFS